MSEAKLVRRSQRVAFYGIPVSGGGEISTYNRMEHFTSLTEGKNPITYERQYVDKDSQDSDVTGYGTTLEYGFDHHSGDTVLADLAKVQDDELKGETRDIVVVDFFDKGESKKDDEYVARKRTYSILPDSSGDGTDALQWEYHKKENGGKHTALNFAHAYIKGEVALILDSDDYLT